LFCCIDFFAIEAFVFELLPRGYICVNGLSCESLKKILNDFHAHFRNMELVIILIKPLSLFVHLTPVYRHVISLQYLKDISIAVLIAISGHMQSKLCNYMLTRVLNAQINLMA